MEETSRAITEGEWVSRETLFFASDLDADFLLRRSSSISSLGTSKTSATQLSDRFFRTYRLNLRFRQICDFARSRSTSQSQALQALLQHNG